MPEDVSGRRHLKIDVYAFGVTLWEMLMQQRPHGDLHAFQIQVQPVPFSETILIMRRYFFL